MTRVVVVDLLCNSPFYCGPFAAALRDSGADAELASPRFYLEPDFLDKYPRSPCSMDLVVHASHPRIVRLAVRSIEVGLNALCLLARIGAHRYDVVHIQWIPLVDRTSVFMRVLRAICDRSGTLLVATVHNVTPHDQVAPDVELLRRNLDLAHLLVAQTAHVADELTRVLGVKASIALIPLGPLFADRPLPPRIDAAKRLDWGSSPTVLFLGLIRSYKGLDLLADAWPQVRVSFPDARLLIVGKVLDAAAKTDLNRVRVQAGVVVVDHYVTVERMLDYYAIGDVVVFPYHQISQSAALMTAACLGRPTVITPVDGLLEQVATLTSAVVADEISGPAIARALTRSLDRLDSLKAAAERDRAAIAESPIGWTAIASATLAAYEAHRNDKRPTEGGEID